MVVLVTVAYFVLVAPIRGLSSYRRLVASKRIDPTALSRFYRHNVGRKWAWLIPITLVFALAPGLRPEHLGLAWPRGPLVNQLTWLLVYAAVILAVSVVVWRKRIRSGRSVPGLRAVRGLTPRTGPERRWALAAHASAGVIEELMMRGLLLAAGLSVGLPPLLVVLGTSALFGLVHLYQGWLGVVGTGLLGALLSLSVLLTGSLLFAVVLHLLLAVRALAVFAADASATRPAAEPHAAATTS